MGKAKARPVPPRRRRVGVARAVVSVVGLVSIVGVLLSVFAAGGNQRGAPTSTTSEATSSCATFDQATGRLAAKDNKGFVDDMTQGALASQAAAAKDGRWRTLEGAFASFATDLAANDAQKVFDDLNAINQVCDAVRGPRPLNLNGQP